MRTMEKETESRDAAICCPKIAFVVLLQVKGANPNGDPLSGNMPRTAPDGRGKMTPVCIKRKIRDRLQEMGQEIYVKCDDRADDGFHSINGRLAANPAVAEALGKRDEEMIRKSILESYIDARAFGGVIAGFKGKEKGMKGISVGIRGAVTVNDVYSAPGHPVVITEDQIVKSTNGEGEEGRSSDRMGSKFSVDYGLYIIQGSVNPFFAEKNGFTREDWEHVKKALLHLCDNDESAARPAGSMAVKKAFFWEGDMTNNGLSRLFDSVRVELRPGVLNPAFYEDYNVSLIPVDDGIEPEVIDAD